MVSLDARNQFIDDLRKTPSSCYAIALVFNEECASKEPTTLADRAAFSVIADDKAQFAKVVVELQRRTIKADADWILDDFLLFVLLVGAKKFRVGDELCKAIVNERRPTNELDAAFNSALRSLLHNAFAIEGAFSFAKLVFCDLINRPRIDKSVARTVYGELTKKGFLHDLDTFPKLLAYRAFDLLLQNGIEEELESVDAIVLAIQARSENMSIGDWGKIALSMRPSVIVWIIGVLIAICTTSFSAGRWFSSPSESSITEPVPIPNSPKHIPAQDSIKTIQNKSP